MSGGPDEDSGYNNFNKNEAQKKFTIITSRSQQPQNTQTKKANTKIVSNPIQTKQSTQFQQIGGLLNAGTSVNQQQVQNSLVSTNPKSTAQQQQVQVQNSSKLKFDVEAYYRVNRKNKTNDSIPSTEPKFKDDNDMKIIESKKREHMNEVNYLTKPSDIILLQATNNVQSTTPQQIQIGASLPKNIIRNPQIIIHSPKNIGYVDSQAQEEKARRQASKDYISKLGDVSHTNKLCDNLDNKANINSSFFKNVSKSSENLSDWNNLGTPVSYDFKKDFKQNEYPEKGSAYEFNINNLISPIGGEGASNSSISFKIVGISPNHKANGKEDKHKEMLSSYEGGNRIYKSGYGGVHGDDVRDLFWNNPRKDAEIAALAGISNSKYIAERDKIDKDISEGNNSNDNSSKEKFSPATNFEGSLLDKSLKEAQGKIKKGDHLRVKIYIKNDKYPPCNDFRSGTKASKCDDYLLDFTKAFRDRGIDVRIKVLNPDAYNPKLEKNNEVVRSTSRYGYVEETSDNKLIIKDGKSPRNELGSWEILDKDAKFNNKYDRYFGFN